MNSRGHETYVDSGDPWLGNVPAHWRVRRADFVIKSRKVQISPSELQDVDIYHYAIPTVQATGAGAVEEGDSVESGKLVIDEPQVLVSKLNPRKATVCVAEPHTELLTVASTEFVPLLPGDADLRYAFYVWKSQKVTDRLSSLVQSVTRSHQRCDPADITKIPWAWPTLAEQKAIARFLDRKTAEIDTLIEKKRHLLDLLAEKRTALITRAVTKGLTPDVPMKDSGIEWLGEIPAHWETGIPIKYLVEMTGGMTPSTSNPLYWNGDIPWVSPKDMKRAEIFDSEDHVTEQAVADTGLRLIDEGAVLMVVRGMILAHSFPVSINRVSVVLNQDMKALRPCKKLLPEYLYFLLASVADHILTLVETSAHGTKALRMDQWREFTIALPPLYEQKSIVVAITQSLSELDALSKATEGTLEKLEEYRSALITNAVTGQIKVA